MVLFDSGLNSEQFSLMRPIYIENCFLVLKQVVLIARMVLISSGLYKGTLLCTYKYVWKVTQKKYRKHQLYWTPWDIQIVFTITRVHRKCIEYYRKDNDCDIKERSL